MGQENERMMLSVTEIQEKYLPFSKKKIRNFVKKYVPHQTIGRSLYAGREALEALLKSSEQKNFTL